MLTLLRPYDYQNVLSVYGGNYNTRDGTQVRDFIHIEDAIDGHLKAKNTLKITMVILFGILAQVEGSVF